MKMGTTPGEAATTVSVRGLHHRYGELQTLGGISFEAGAGEIVALVGISGCGKSTLLEIVAGLTEPADGAVEVGGRGDSAARLERCAWMPQRDQLLPWRRAVDNAALALRLNGHSRAEARQGALPLLNRLGLAKFADAFPHQLSGGMRQRVAFARTLLSGKGVLLLDEPFASLDAITRADLQEWLLAGLAAERRTTLLVTHDVEEALFVADRVLLLSPRPGRVIWEVASPVDRELSRPEAIATAAFVDCRERALEALGESRA
jgi:ABC-type nitrate/sulfonate/bicarbonate transport system ATPase subunit